MQIAVLFWLLLAILPWFYHLYYCFTHHEYVLLLVGAVLAPIGWIHGLGAFFNWWQIYRTLLGEFYYIYIIGVYLEFIVIGCAVFFNIAVIKWKYDKARYADALLDFVCLVSVSILFSGSYAALVVGTIASALVSIYLLVSPPKLPIKKRNI